MMGQLYDVEPHTINYHLKKIFGGSELVEDSVTRKFRVTAADGKSYNTKHFTILVLAQRFGAPGGLYQPYNQPYNDLPLCKKVV